MTLMSFSLTRPAVCKIMKLVYFHTLAFAPELTVPNYYRMNSASHESVSQGKSSETANRRRGLIPIQLVATNNPDKIIFVGEALVGNEAVDQLTKFDRALRDFSAGSGLGKGRGIDGMLVTKWDTVDDKVRAFLRFHFWVCLFTTRYFPTGRCSPVNDLCHRTANTFRGVWPSKPTLCYRILFLLTCCSQTYTDLRQLRVPNVVQAILSD